MVNKKEFEGYICEITNKPIREMRLCPDKQQKLKVRIKCDKGCVWCEKERRQWRSMLIQVEDKTIVNIRYVRSIWIYEHQYKEGEKEYLVKCEMTEETDETVKTCNTREEAEKALEQILNQYDRGQRVIKIK